MKKRLIGSIVFGCLAIILIPILLDGEGLRSPELDLDIPESPAIPAIPELQAYRPDIPEAPEDNTERPASVLVSPITDTISQGEQSSQEAAQQSVQEQVNEIPERPRLTEEMIPEAWAVRLGVFENKDNATGLKNRLLELGYKAYSRPLTTSVTASQRELTAVFVGPLLTRTEALSMVAELKQTINEDGVVVEFTIDN